MSATASPVIAARRAISAATALGAFAIVFLALGLGGALITVLIGFTPQCPPGELTCSSYEKEGSGTLIGLGLAGALATALSFFLLLAIASRVSLAGHVALAQFEAPAAPVGSRIQAPREPAPTGPGFPEFHPMGCPVCGSRRVRRGACLRCGAEAVEFESMEGWYEDPGDSTQEKFFDGERWQPEVRPTTRHTLESGDRSVPQWLVDPDDIGRDRYWDGSAWTSRVRDAWGDDEEQTEPGRSS